MNIFFQEVIDGCYVSSALVYVLSAHNNNNVWVKLHTILGFCNLFTALEFIFLVLWEPLPKALYLKECGIKNVFDTWACNLFNASLLYNMK